MLKLSPQENAKTFGVRIGDVNAKPLLKTLPWNQRPAKAKENLDRLFYLMTYSLVDTKTHLNILKHLKAEILIDRLGDTLSRARSQNFCDANGNVQAYTIVETVAYTLKEAQAKRNRQKQGDVEIEALINMMADTLLDRKVKTFVKTLRDVEAM